jgi:hypothetical protein
LVKVAKIGEGTWPRNGYGDVGHEFDNENLRKGDILADVAGMG